jgi:flagellar motor switch protein FliM
VASPRGEGLSAEQTRALQELHEPYARGVSAALEAFLRVPVETMLAAIEQETSERLVRQAGAATYLGSLAVRPWGALGLLHMDLCIAKVLVDVLLGGSGNAGEETQGITEVEAQVLESLFPLLCRELQLSWQPALSLAVSFVERQAPGRRQPVLPGEEKLLRLALEIQIQETRGLFIVALPAVATTALLRKLAEQGSYSPRRKSATSNDQLRHKLEHSCAASTCGCA